MSQSNRVASKPLKVIALVQELLVCLDVSTEVHSQAAIVSVDVDCERASFLMLKTL